jgi:O-succinylbenzoic acid--CoA ligase
MAEQGLWLNDRYYSPQALATLCQQRLSQPHLPDWEGDLYRFIRQWLSHDPNHQIHTSGSTGRPKEITVRKEAMRRSAQMTGGYFRLAPQQSALLCLPADHIAGQMMVVRAWELGLKLICRPPQQLDLANLPRLDFAAMVPRQLHRLVYEEPAGMARLARIEKLLLGGAPLTPDLQTRLAELPGEVYQSYAMTETLSHVAIRRLHPDPQSDFQALPGITVDVDGRGCARIDAPQLAVSDLTTNDMIRLTGPNRFQLLGRIDNVINSGGYKWHPEQMEQQLVARHEALRNLPLCIGGVADPVLGERLVLIAEGDESLRSTLTQACQETFPPYQCPKQILLLPRLRYTPGGKIRRQATLQAAVTATQVPEPAEAPHKPVGRK